MWSRVTIESSGCWVAKHVELAPEMTVGERLRLTGVARRLWVTLSGDRADVEVVSLCGNPRCVCPRHFKVVGERVLPGGKLPTSVCIRGHEFSRDNVYTYPDGGYRCRACQREVYTPAAKARRAAG